MCGIWGIIIKNNSGLFYAEETFVSSAMLAGTVRGEHGTGMFFSPAKDTKLVAWLKKKSNPYWMIYDKKFPEFWKALKDSAKYVVGHNRHATKGEITDDNTHPFQHKHITMVHNGTINWGLTFPKGVEVDSHALTIALAEEGIQIFEKISGAFACVWHDAESRTLNIAKNNERPLSMVKVSNGNYFFASEKGMLDWLVQRSHKNNSLTFEDFPIENNKLYSFNLEKLGEPEVTPLPEKKTYHYQTGTSSGAASSNNIQEITKTSNQTTSKKTIKNEHLIRFNIISKQLQRFNNIELWRYFGRSEDKEAVWFQSKDEFPVDNTLYEGEIAEYDIDKFPNLGTNVIWYKVKPRTILIIEGIKKQKQTTLALPNNIKDEIQDELTQQCVLAALETNNTTCVECNSPIAKEDKEKCEFVAVNNIRYRLLCPDCTATFSWKPRITLQ